MPAAQLAGVPDPGGLRGAIFGELRGSGPPSAKNTGNGYHEPKTLIAAGTEIGGRPASSLFCAPLFERLLAVSFSEQVHNADQSPRQCEEGIVHGECLRVGEKPSLTRYPFIRIGQE